MTASERILEVLKRGPMAIDDIAKTADVPRGSMYTYLGQLKKRGKVVSEKSDAGIVYRLGDAPAETQTRKKPTPPGPRVKKQRAAPPKATNPTAAILTRAVESAQQALDEYVVSVCDATILAHLKKSRDEARAALECVK